MMKTEDKTMFCFCHWGRKNKVLPDGSASYAGGITDQIIVKTGIKYNDFVNAVFDRLGIDPSDKMLHFTVKFDRSELIRLRDQEGVNTLLQFNDGSAHIYATSSEKECTSRPTSGGVEKVEPNERGGVPAGSFECDPASLPLKPDDIWYPGKVKEDSRTGNSEPVENVLSAVLPRTRAKSKISENATTSLKSEDLNGIHATDGESLKVRMSPRGVNITEKKRRLMSSCTANDSRPTDFGDNCVKKSYCSSLEEPRQPSGGAEIPEFLVESDAVPDTIPDIDPSERVNCSDPKSSDFDKHKAENCFAVDQIWAVYGELDVLPRFYAHITKVYGPEFKIKLRPLVPHPEDQRENGWVSACLPVGCGKFSRGGTYYTNNPLIFSHLMLCEKGTRGLYIVYPRKGETWALFKDWDMSWSSNPDNHRKYKYAIVEILSDYVVDVGVQVSYLDKVAGFRCLFQRTRPTEVGTFIVKPNELYKFSHWVPSKGEPTGSFELDPASLPLNADDIWCPVEVKVENRTANSEPVENVLTSVPLGTIDKTRVPGNGTTSLKFGDLNGIHATDGESAKVRRSPRGVNISEKKQSLSSRAANDSPSTDFGDNCAKRSRRSSLEEDPNSRGPSGGEQKTELAVDSDSEPDAIPDSNPPKPTSSAMQETFWTECPICKSRYMFYRNHMKRCLHCRKCSMPFIARDLDSQRVSRGPKRSQPVDQYVPLESNLNQPFEQKELPKKGTSKSTAGSAGFPPTQTRS